MAFLSGPSFAKELVEDIPTAVVAASEGLHSFFFAFSFFAIDSIWQIIRQGYVPGGSANLLASADACIHVQ